MGQQRKAERGSIVGRVACDFLTITTFHTEQYQLVRDALWPILASEKWQYGTMRGYETAYTKALIFGEGRQNGEPHYIISINGLEAARALDALTTLTGFKIDAWKATRLDVQLTERTERQVRLSMIAQSYGDGELGEFEGRGRPSVWAIAGSDGDTLYIGKGTSDKMLRIYEKPVLINGRREVLDRYEVQLRRGRANGLFRRLLKYRGRVDYTSATGFMRYEYERLPVGMQVTIAFAEYVDGTGAADVAPVQADPEPDAKVKWLLSCESTIQHLMSAPGYNGRRVREMVLRVLVLAVTGDKYAQTQLYRLLSPQGEVYQVLTCEPTCPMLKAYQAARRGRGVPV